MWLLVLNWKFVAIGSNLELHPKILFAHLPILYLSIEVIGVVIAYDSLCQIGIVLLSGID
jgi:hypothetical protein